MYQKNYGDLEALDIPLGRINLLQGDCDFDIPYGISADKYLDATPYSPTYFRFQNSNNVNVDDVIYLTNVKKDDLIYAVFDFNILNYSNDQHTTISVLEGILDTLSQLTSLIPFIGGFVSAMISILKFVINISQQVEVKITIRDETTNLIIAEEFWLENLSAIFDGNYKTTLLGHILHKAVQNYSSISVTPSYRIIPPYSFHAVYLLWNSIKDELLIVFTTLDTLGLNFNNSGNICQRFYNLLVNQVTWTLFPGANINTGIPNLLDIPNNYIITIPSIPNSPAIIWQGLSAYSFATDNIGDTTISFLDIFTCFYDTYISSALCGVASVSNASGDNAARQLDEFYNLFLNYYIFKFPRLKSGAFEVIHFN